MTVASTSNRKTYAGDNVSTSFDTSPVVFFETSNLEIRVTVNATGETALLVENTHYTVSGGDGTTGTVTLVANPPVGNGTRPNTVVTGATLVILRVLPITQTTDFVNGDNSDAEVAEQALDRLTMVEQQEDEIIGRAIHFPAGDVSGSVTEVPAVASRSGRLLGFDATGLLTTFIVQVGTSIVDLAVGTGASLIGYLHSATGAVLRTLDSILNESVSVFYFMTSAQIADVKARGLTLNVASALQAAQNFANSTGDTLRYPAGSYLIGTTTLIFKNSVRNVGAGKSSSGTLIQYTGTSDAIQINNPINSSTAANIYIGDMSVICTTLTAGKASIADVGSSYLVLERVRTTGNAFGVIFDQSELAVVRQCQFDLAASATAGLWLVNAADHTGGASSFFTNRITIVENQFNGPATGVAVVDDGGTTHVYRDNNFNACAKHIRFASAIDILIQGNQFETCATTSIEFAATRLNGSGATTSTEAEIASNFFSSSDAIPFLTFAVASLSELGINTNHFNNINVSGTIASGASNVLRWNGRNNTQAGTGADPDTTFINNYNVKVTATPTWKATSGDPVLNNGTSSQSYERNGNLITVHITVTMGSSTTFGTGDWYFTMPFSLVGNDNAQGSASFLDNSAGAFFTATSSISTLEPTKCRLIVNNNTVQVGATVPFTWATLDQVHLSITFPITKSAS